MIDIQTKTEVVNMYNSGMPVADILTKFSISRSWLYSVITDKHRIKITRSKVVPVTSKPRPNLSKGNLGEAARQVVIGKLMMNGINVFRPTMEDTPIDILIFSSDGRALKCQCKYIYPTKKGSHDMRLTSSRGARYDTGKMFNHVYTGDEVDFFLGYCMDNDSVYVIPHSVCQGRQQITFWVLRGPCKGGPAIFKSEQYRSAYHLLH